MKMERDKEELQCKEKQGNVMEERLSNPPTRLLLVMHVHTNPHARTHTAVHSFLFPDRLILSPQGGVGLEESGGFVWTQKSEE